VNASVERALRILALFEETHRELTLSDIAKALDTKSGSVYTTVFTLLARNYLARDPATKRFRLGLELLTRADQVLSSLDLRTVAKPVLKTLAREMAVNVHLAVLYEGSVMYLDREEAAPGVVLVSIVGKRVPGNCTALGKVLLAYNRDALEQMIDRGELAAMTHNSVASPGALRKEMEKIIRMGYAVDDEEFHEGTLCVAAPIRDYSGSVIAAVSISLAKSRAKHEGIPAFARSVLDGAKQVSDQLGYRE
jgi:IclR family KDG regulon transcriptional repressor